MDEDIWVDALAGEKDEHGVVLAAQDSPVRNQESSTVVPGICDPTHAEDRYHRGAGGSADILPFFVADACDGARGRLHRSWRHTCSDGSVLFAQETAMYRTARAGRHECREVHQASRQFG